MTGKAAVEQFFAHEPEILPLFEAWAEAICDRHPATEVQVQASQISFRAPRPFCTAWLPIRRGIKGRPERYLVVSFGLNRETRHPRLVDTVEPYPGRWTHHTIVAGDDEIDAQLPGWIAQACAWKNGDRRRD